MKHNRLIMFAMACITVMFVSTTLAPAQNHTRDKAGRYQAVIAGHPGGTDVAVIDTQTGEMYKYIANGNSKRIRGSF